MQRVSAQGQLQRVRPLPERQVPPDLQDEAMREAHREKAKGTGGGQRRHRAQRHKIWGKQIQMCNMCLLYM